jgi:hypothetical protein
VYYSVSKFARDAQIVRRGKHLGVGSFSREGAKTPSSEKNFFLQNLCAFAPLREIFRDLVAALPRWSFVVSPAPRKPQKNQKEKLPHDHRAANEDSLRTL